MAPREALALINIAETLDRISQLVAMGREAVERDSFLPLAAEQLGIRLGHYLTALPEAWRAARPQVPWQSIRGLRNRLAHNYHEIDFDILWDAYAVAVPTMRATRAIAAAEGETSPEEQP